MDVKISFFFFFSLTLYLQNSLVIYATKLFVSFFFLLHPNYNIYSFCCSYWPNQCLYYACIVYIFLCIYLHRKRFLLVCCTQYYVYIFFFLHFFVTYTRNSLFIFFFISSKENGKNYVLILKKKVSLISLTLFFLLDKFLYFFL